jgi:hypothetical protein
MVTAPRSVFEELKLKPAWFGATLFLAVFSLVVAFFIYDPVLYPNMLEQAEEQATSSEQLAQMEDLYSSPGFRIFVSVTAPLANFVFVIVTGLLLFAACSMLMGGRTTARHGFAVAAHSFLILIVRSVVLLPIMISKQDPQVSLGPGVFFPPSEAVGFGQHFIASFLGGLALFNLWALALCILGMSVVAGLPTGKVGRVFAIGYLVIIIIWSLVGGAFGSR